MFDELSGDQKTFREKLHDFFSRSSNPKSLKAFGIVFLVSMILIGSVALASGPLFHSVVQLPCLPDLKAPGSPCGDPSTTIWQSTAISDWNIANVSNFANPSWINNGSCRTSVSCLFSQNFGTGNGTAVALTKDTIGDLSVISGKTLAFHFSWIMSGIANGACGGNQCQSNPNIPFGFYLTTNSTLPLTSSYDPITDPSVALLDTIQCTVNCLTNANGNSATWKNDVFFLRTLGQKHTISSENTGCTGGSSSCFLETSQVINSLAGPSATLFNDQVLYGNYTAVTGTQACSIGASLVSGPGCSFILDETQGTNLQGSSTQNLPFFNFQAQQYYLGVYTKLNPGVQMDYSFQVGPTGNMDSFYYVPTPTGTIVGPQIDTGGFFGPIIKALISIGVFIAQNIINFLSYLATLLWPTLASVFSILANALKTVLNSVGQFFGLGNIGDNIILFFSGIVSWLTNVLGNAFVQITNISNLFAPIVAIFTSLFGGPIWTAVVGLANLVASGWSTIIAAYNLLTQLSTNGLLGLNYYFLVDWVFGMFMLSTKGMEGFKTWIDLNALVFGKLAMVIFFFVKESVQILVWLKQLVVNWI